MYSPFPFACLLLIAGFVASGFSADEPRPPLTKKEKAEVFKLIEESKEFKEAASGKKKVVPASAWSYREKDGKREVEFVETLHFNYNNNQTIRTLYNRTDKRVVRVESLEAYPTPLADEELERAKKI